MFVAEVLEDPCNVSTASAVGVGTKEGSSIEEGSSGAIDSVNNYQLRRVSDHDYELLAKKTKACVVMPLNDDGTGTSTGNEDDVVNAIGGAISSTGGNTLVQRSSTSSFVDALMAGRFSTNQIALPQQQACAAAIHSGFGELWSTRVKRLKDNSPYGHLPGWRCVSFMVRDSSKIVYRHRYNLLSILQFICPACIPSMCGQRTRPLMILTEHVPPLIPSK